MNNNEVKYVVDRIKSISSAINSEFFQHHMNVNFGDDYIEEYPGYTHSWLIEAISSLYFDILAFFELKGLYKSYDLFHDRFNFVLNKKKQEVLEEEQYSPEEMMELKIMHDFFVHLRPYPEFSYKLEDSSEVLKLQNILKNTNHIIKRLGVDLNSGNESDIYKAVKWVIGMYFPSARHKNKASFIQEFKAYEPDILIPEISTSIEYKYIRTDKENEIENYVDQLKIDATNYVGDHRFTNHIAVIYLKDSVITTHERIFECWKSKNFPKNWKLILSFN